MTWIDPRQPVNWGHPLTAGLLAWWQVVPAFAGGQRLVDLTKRHHGTLQGGVTWTGPRGRRGGQGALGGFADGNGAVGLSDAAIRTLPLQPAWTLSLWAVAAANTTSAAAIAWSGTDDLLLYPYDSVNGPGVRLFWRRLTLTSIVNEDGVDRSGAWHHFVVRQTGLTARAVLVDGHLVGSDARNTANAGPFEDATQLGNWAGGAQPFPGLLDDVMLYDRALSDAEVVALFHLTQRLDTPMLRHVRPRLYSLPPVPLPPPPTAGVPATHRQAFAVTTRHRQAFAVTTRHRQAFEVTRTQRAPFERE